MPHNHLGQLLEGSINSLNDIVKTAQNYAQDLRLINEKLSIANKGHANPGCTLVRGALMMNWVSLLADDLDPCFQLTHENTGLPRSQVQEWYRRREEQGLIRIEEKPHRDIYICEGAFSDECIIALDGLTTARLSRLKIA